MSAIAYRLFLRRELLGRATTILTIVCLLPALGGALFRAFQAGGTLGYLENTVAPIFLNVLVPLVALFHAVAAFHEEFENRTIVYLLTRPVTRTRYVVAKFLAAWTSVVFSLAIGLIAVWAVCVLGVSSHYARWLGFAGTLAVAATLSAGVYSAAFLLLGLSIRNPVLVGLAFTFWWETVVGQIPGNLRYWTLGLYPRSLFVEWYVHPDPDVFDVGGFTPSSAGSTPDLPIRQMAGSDLLPEFARPGPITSLAVIAALIVVFLGLATVLFRRREDA